MMTEKLLAEHLRVSIAENVDVELDVFVHETIDSTNSWCLRESKSGRALPFACFAERQTSGRGRRGKRWYTAANNSIAMSLAWPFVLSEQLLQLLPLSIALSIVKTLEDVGISSVQIKWPNDVYVHGKKIAGILVETQTIKTQTIKSEQADKNITHGKQVAVVLGLGLNFKMPMIDSLEIDSLEIESPEIDEPLVCTDICNQINLQKISAVPNREVVAAALLQHVVLACQNFTQTSGENLEKFRTSYDYCYQKKVELVLDNNERLSGVAQGVNDNAELLVLIDGEQRAFNSADVSVRPDAVASE